MSRLCLSIIALALLALPFTASAQSKEELQLGYLKGQAVVKLRESMDRGAQEAFLASLRLDAHYYYPTIRAFWVKFDPSRPVPEVITMLRGHPDVEWVHENALGKRSVNFPNDPNFSKCYALHNTGQSISFNSGTNDADMDMPEAWDLLTDASNVIIAIIDSGARLTHQDLSANIWTNPGEIPNNGIDDDNNGKIDDVNGWAFDTNNNSVNDNDGHGTNVTGCTAASGNNGIGTTGVCWVAKVMICKDGDASPSVAASAAGMEYAAMNGAVVANFSTGYGGGNYSVLQAAVNTAQSLGMIICVAAGNSNTNLNTSSDAPATYTNDNLIVVGASDNDDGKASFSSYGNIHVDVAAAGVDVYTTRRNNNSSYGYVDGTSFSAPLTTGVVGLIRAYNTSASYQTVRSAIISTCDVVSAWNGKCASNGRVNCFAAMQLVGSGGGGGSAVSPNPMSFAQTPSPSSATTTSMTATTATTQSGDPVQYKFTLSSSTGTGGSSSSWQSSTSFTDTALEPNRTYGYTVTARNAVTQVAGSASAESTTVTYAAVPGLVTLSNVTTTHFKIGDIDLNGNPSNTQVAIEVNGQYLAFNGVLSANPMWLSKAVWVLSTGPTVAGTQAHAVRCKARNTSGIETAFGPSTGSGGGGASTLGACGSGNVVVVGGGFQDVFTINNSAGGVNRHVTVGVGQPFTLRMDKPLINSQLTANFHLAVWLGVPDASQVTALPFNIGSMCFPICEVLPGGPTFTVASSFGPTNCGAPALVANPADWSFTHPGLVFPLQDITFQGVIEIYPGLLRVTNGVIFNVN